MGVMSLSYLRLRSYLVLIIKYQHMDKQWNILLWLILGNKLPIPFGKTVSNIMQIIYEPLYLFICIEPMHLFICMDLSTTLFEWI
jgi:hypothetical protein